MMKLILIPAMLLGFVEGGAQHVNLRLRAEENEVPRKVVGAFRQEFGKETEATWAIISSSSLQAEFGIRDNTKGEKSTYYEVSFSASDGNKEVVYDHFGHNVGVKKAVATASLPSPVARTVQDMTKSAEIVSAEEVLDAASAPPYYLIVVRREGDLQSIVVRASGEIVKTN
ncbi:hypothetical protein WBG78_27995 [Chryseolinea sp. T2]|uniref:hypothetical protein n=1 Tax=Chryseolinea sp. T2 TaxID=3129255 RepID=UPI003077D298